MEEKTVDIVVQEYEEQIKNLKQEHETEIKNLKEEHAQEVRAIISGRKIPEETKPTEKEEKNFYTNEIEKTMKKLKLK